MAESTTLDEQEAHRILVQFRIVAGLVVVALAIGTVFYHYVEDFSWLDSIYFCVVTLATVGYGDITPETSAGKIFTMFYILSGIGLIATFASLGIKRRWVVHSARHEKRLKKHSSK